MQRPLEPRCRQHLLSRVHIHANGQPNSWTFSSFSVGFVHHAPLGAFVAWQMSVKSPRDVFRIIAHAHLRCTARRDTAVVRNAGWDSTVDKGRGSFHWPSTQATTWLINVAKYRMFSLTGAHCQRLVQKILMVWITLRRCISNQTWTEKYIISSPFTHHVSRTGNRAGAEWVSQK